MKVIKTSLDLVWLKTEAQQAYILFSLKTATAMHEQKIRPEEVSDEEAEVREDGVLVVFVMARGTRIVEFEIPPGDWGFNESFLN